VQPWPPARLPRGRVVGVLPADQLPVDEHEVLAAVGGDEYARQVGAPSSPQRQAERALSM
jgi:hypothetical protein